MIHNGKYYYRIGWTCGYSGTEDYDIIESDEPIGEEKLQEEAKERWLESCGEYFTGEPDEDEMIDAGYMEDPYED